MCTVVYRCSWVLMKKERIVFYANKTDKDLLERISKQTGAPASELLRRALKAMLKEQK